MMKQLCPCHSGQPYQDCCAPLHLGQYAPSAERLMRSRYSAYVLKLEDYLRNTWHASTRPNDLTQMDLQGIKWLGLTVIEERTHTSANATVSFKAKFRHISSSKQSQKTQTLHETSHFVLEHGQWFYVDGKIHAE